jgi:hypothetical protein
VRAFHKVDEDDLVLDAELVADGHDALRACGKLDLCESRLATTRRHRTRTYSVNLNRHHLGVIRGVGELERDSWVRRAIGTCAGLYS